jgi:hypothetical protein
MIKWLREKLRNWLCKDLIERMNGLTKLIEVQQKSINGLSDIAKTQNKSMGYLREQIKDLSTQCAMLPKITDAGMDVGLDGKGHKHWAVFCATGGGQDYVKFVDISSMNYKDIVEMAKRLEKNEQHYKEYSRTKLDAPMGMKDIFYYERGK